MSKTTSAAGEGALEWSSILARGPQSEQFLQGQLSQDLLAVSDEGVWALLLAPDSVVVTSCHVARVPDGYALTVPRSLGEEALARLRRFLLRTDCALDLVEVDRGPFSTIAEQISAGAPGLAEFAARLTPHSFGPSFVASTISFTKGCFTGQELVGRLDARGSSVPWRLVRASGPSAQRIDEVLKSKGPAGPQGVTSAVVSGDRVVALGIAHRTLLGDESLADALGVIVEPIG
jgi:folate-binding Fe-S cluster repair protein YgfZ